MEFNASLNQLTQIGDQSKKISTELIEKHSQIAWLSIKAFRNRIIHQYKGIEVENVFNIINKYLPDLLVETGSIISTELKSGNFDPKEFEIAKTSPYLQHVDFGAIV